MREVIAVLLMIVAGMFGIGFGVYLEFGEGYALIAVGTACLFAAFVTVRGLSRA